MSDSGASELAERAGRYRPAIQREMRDAVGDRPELLYRWMRYHLGWEDRDGRPVEASPGKMMRPVAAMLATELLGGEVTHALPAAAAIELIHNFSLLHDDVEDASHFRRGRENLWVFAGAPQAINTGDGMFVVARLAEYRMLDAGLAEDRALAVMREIDEACLSLVEGQYDDMSFETRDEVTLEEYEVMAAGKTAALFAAPFAVGALVAGASAETVDALRRYGRHVGLAFQMVDDILGIWGDPAVTGKPVGDDLATRKMTYPVIVALSDPGEAGRAFRAAYARPPGADEGIAEMAHLVETAGARARTEARARGELEQAAAALDSATLSPEGRALLDAFAGTAVGRVS